MTKSIFCNTGSPRRPQFPTIAGAHSPLHRNAPSVRQSTTGAGSTSLFYAASAIQAALSALEAELSVIRTLDPNGGACRALEHALLTMRNATVSGSSVAWGTIDDARTIAGGRALSTVTGWAAQNEGVWAQKHANVWQIDLAGFHAWYTANRTRLDARKRQNRRVRFDQSGDVVGSAR